MKPNVQTPPHQAAWNKGKLIGQKTPLKLKEAYVQTARALALRHLHFICVGKRVEYGHGPFQTRAATA